MPENSQLDATTSADKGTEWAETRTDLAEDRTIQAIERTFAGWVRTALAAIGVGIAFHVVFGAFQPPWSAQAIASLFIMLGISVVCAAEKRACSSLARLSNHEVDRPENTNFRWITWSIMAGGMALILGILFLNDGFIGKGD